MTKPAHAHAAIVLMSMLLFACASPPGNLFPPGPGEASRTIYLVSHGWHAGIVIKRADIPAGVWPQHNEFPAAQYLEVGWGDMDYYMTPQPGLGILLKAGLWPTASVLHVVGFRGPVTDYFARSRVIAIELSAAGFERLCRYLEDSYARDETAASRPLGPSLYGDGRFYLSRETYHVFNTCNAWTARALRAAGIPLTPAGNLGVDSLMTNAAKFGSVIRSGPRAPESRPGPGGTDAGRPRAEQKSKNRPVSIPANSATDRGRPIGTAGAENMVGRVNHDEARRPRRK